MDHGKKGIRPVRREARGQASQRRSDGRSNGHGKHGSSTNGLGEHGRSGSRHSNQITAGSFRLTSYPSFGSVKAMTLLSSTSTYDTLLMTTRGCALHTAHIPLTSPMRPVLKVVRASTWQRLKTLIANHCGQNGTLLLGIDKDTGAGDLYTVGHANGTSTVIRRLGKTPGTFTDPVNFHWTNYKRLALVRRVVRQLNLLRTSRTRTA